ncbi:MAG: endolytic transglycosylase MltG [Clostridia bacterium]|nr:endolytic transglycosylase MltG [Clostridia bacterium]
MDNKYNENFDSSSDDSEEMEDLFLRVVKRNEPQSSETSQNTRINNSTENSSYELNAETKAIPKIQQKQVPSENESSSVSQMRTPQREIKKPIQEQKRNVPSAVRGEYTGRRTQIPLQSAGRTINKKTVDQTHPINPAHPGSGRISNSPSHADSAATSYYSKVPQIRSRSGESDMSATIQQRPVPKNYLAGRATPPRGRTGKGKSSKGKSDNYKGSALSSVLKAVIYIVSVFVIAGLIGYYGIQIGNDVFAFVKSDAEIEITIDENTSTSELASLLKKNGVIKYPGIFKLYASLRHDDKPYVAGTYTVKPSMNFDDLRKTFHEQAAEVTVLSITIPEGYTVDQIIDLFTSNGLGTRDGFIDAIQNYNFEGYWFLDELESNPERKYRLEGYLYPDTYYFYNNASEISIIYKLLDRFSGIFPDEYRDACREKGMTVDQIVTLASMIQMEAKYESEYGWISSVFHNRLNNPSYETKGFLQSDATTLYGLAERKETVTPEDNQIDTPYNTYTRKGLPAGPITNPSFSAITWALYPAETDYYYFVAKSDGYNLFAKTSAEHARNIIEARGG